MAPSGSASEPHASCRVRRNAFTIRIINEWNGLLSSAIRSPLVDKFKQRLESHWKLYWYWIPDTDLVMAQTPEVDENGFHRPLIWS